MLAVKIYFILYVTNTAGSCAGRLLVCPHLAVLHFTTLPTGAEGGLWSLIVALPGDPFIVFALF